jgi:DNA transformation protein
MFGGAGIWAEGTMFALVSDGEIFLKADEVTIPTLEAEGSQPFVYEARGRRVALSYWRLPERLLDDPEELARFARAALAVARRAAAKKERPKARRDLKRPVARPRRRAQSRR